MKKERKHRSRKASVNWIFGKYREAKLAGMEGVELMQYMGAFQEFEDTEGSQMTLASALRRYGGPVLRLLEEEAKENSFKLMDALLKLPPKEVVEAVKTGAMERGGQDD